ncbi:UNVERIFIED_CONTAM: hypothetical protein FKN15_023294 [Acipenser sinensis]
MVMPFVDQDLSHIMKKGKLTDKMISYILYQILQGLKAKRYIQALPPQVKRNFREAFPNMDKKVVDLLEKMLVLDPDRRLTAREGLSHRYLEEYHDPESEPDSMPYDDSFENLELPVEEWRMVDLLEKMLVLDPDRRLTAREGLSHRYLEEYHDPESEPDSMPYDDSFENLELPVEEWRSLIHMEIMTFDPDNPRQTAT